MNSAGHWSQSATIMTLPSAVFVSRARFQAYLQWMAGLPSAYKQAFILMRSLVALSQLRSSAEKHLTCDEKCSIILLNDTTTGVI